MARISTYPIDSGVSGGDMLIGTDVDNANATKNFTVSNLISYAATNNLVPYTGATQNVDLGSFDLLVGGTLGVTGLSTLGAVNATSLSLSTTLGVTGLSTLGDVDVNGDIDFNGLFSISGSQGLAGELLTSTGAGSPPIWSNPLTGYVPYIGATTSVDLGANDLSCLGIDIGTGPLKVNGSAGTINQVLVSQGAGTNPAWQTPPYVYAEYASFYSTQTQITSPTDPPAAMTYNNTDISNPAITIVNDGLGNPNRITFSQTGVYNIQFSAQLEKTGGSDHQIYIWFRKNGSDIANSNTNITLKANQNYAVAAWNLFVSVTAAQYVEIMWFHTGTVSLKYEAANGTIPCPATPSVILTVNRVSPI
jgi:hypothetical protein